MSIGLQHTEELLTLKHIQLPITRIRTDRTYCLCVGIPLGGCISTCVSNSWDAGQAGEAEEAAGRRGAVLLRGV